MRQRALASVLVGVVAVAGVATSLAGTATLALAQAPAAADAPRTMTFSWTLYPRMWAEVDLRLVAGAEAVAEVTAEGGEVTWNLHSHPNPDSPATFVVLGQGAARQTSVRCAPDTSGFYSYLFGNDKAAVPVRLRVEITLRGEARLEGVKP
jgi:hypothetical protein